MSRFFFFSFLFFIFFVVAILEIPLCVLMKSAFYASMLDL